MGFGKTNIQFMWCVGRLVENQSIDLAPLQSHFFQEKDGAQNRPLPAPGPFNARALDVLGRCFVAFMAALLMDRKKSEFEEIWFISWCSIHLQFLNTVASKSEKVGVLVWKSTSHLSILFTLQYSTVVRT